MKIAALSIRKKIISGSALLLFMVCFTAFMMYEIVLQVERKVALVEVIDDILKTTLELRRYEKNYFLYGQEKDLDDALNYLGTLQQQLEGNSPELNRHVPTNQIEDIFRSMAAYKNDLLKLENLGISEKQNRLYLDLQEQVRQHGKTLTDFAEKAVLTERASIKSLLQTTRSIQVVSALASVILATVMAVILGRKVVSSLRLLEGYTKKIAHGEMLEPPQAEAEEEINVLLRAFKRMNLELQARQRQLVQSEKLAALGTLLAGVAHELNNPLSNISTSAQILSEEIEQADLDFKKSLLRQIESQTDKARDIVRTLLEFSRVKEFHREDTSLKMLLDDTMRLIKGQLPKDVAIAIDIPADIIVHVDKQRMQQVFLNLIKNAIDALEKSGHIWINAQKSHTERDRVVEIMVEDDGPGIPPDLREKIFDPFFTTKDVGKGSGLGLYVVHDIIESHGGHIAVESNPGAGTTFVIWLRDDDDGETI
ncbi:MAG: GHKL domain-containing protein [Deltaproteobacteria bacterium]|nr:GHKL domain-containing protein [Deltaproteobacteria bacterium]